MPKTRGEVKSDFAELYDYVVLNDAERVKLTGMKVGQTIFQRDNTNEYVATGSSTLTQINTGGGTSSLEEWTPTVIAETTVVDVDSVNTTIVDNGNGTTLSNTTQAGPLGAGFFASATPDFTHFDAVERGYYVSPTIIENGNNNSSIYFAFSDGNPVTGDPAATYAVGIALRNIGVNQWRFESLTGIDSSLSAVFTDAEIVNSNIGISVSTDGTNVTFKVYKDGTSASAPILTLVELASNFLGVVSPLVVDVTFGVYAQTAIAFDTEVLSYKVAPIEYTPITKYTSGSIINPASYPALRNNKSFQIVGLGADIESVIGTVYDGVIMSFDGVGDPASRTSRIEGVSADGLNVFTNINNFLGQTNLDENTNINGNRIASISTPFTRVDVATDSNFTAINGYKYIDETSVGTGVITMPDPSFDSFEVDFLKLLTNSAGNADGYSLNTGGGSWYINGVQTVSNSYTPVKGEYVKAIYNVDNSTWHIVSFKTILDTSAWTQITTGGSTGIDGLTLGKYAANVNHTFSISTANASLGDEFKIMNNIGSFGPSDYVVLVGGASTMQMAGRELTHQLNILDGQIVTGTFDGAIWQLSVEEETIKFNQIVNAGDYIIGRNYLFDASVTSGVINIFNNGGNAGVSSVVHFEAGGATLNGTPVNAGDIFLVIIDSLANIITTLISGGGSGFDNTSLASYVAAGDINLDVASTNEIALGIQTDDMNSGGPSDLAIATKKYVDDRTVNFVYTNSIGDSNTFVETNTLTNSIKIAPDEGNNSYIDFEPSTGFSKCHFRKGMTLNLHDNSDTEMLRIQPDVTSVDFISGSSRDIKLQGMSSNIILKGTNVLVDLLGTFDASGGKSVIFPSYTVAGAGAQTPFAGAMIYVTDEIAGPVMAFGDGTNWRRVTDRLIIT